ncbi:MAG TPA: hypothetical protein PKZ36_00695 [Candidatus Paceibacterota bacterium]|nr:hypothetical protein [Candidatus Paceibacterota bacterium]HPT17917.1 hypothetical protein [Candidatus Paceibacterota bacterium]
MNEEKICCPKFDPTPWDNKEVVWSDKLFIKEKTCSLFYMPLNMGSMMKKVCTKMEKSGASPDVKDWVMLSRDLSPWKCEHYLAVNKEVSDSDNVKLSGTFLTKVFEGPYKEVKNWYKEMQKLAEEKVVDKNNIYFYYTTCPKCAKKWGKNYVVGFLKIR